MPNRAPLLVALALLTIAGCGGRSASPTGTTGGETNTADPEPAAAPSEDASSPTPGGGEEGGAPTCASVRCASGTHCEVRQVMCVRAPCPPLPECVAD